MHPGPDDALAGLLRRSDAACPMCGHGLSGISSSQCPECGRRLMARLGIDPEPARVPARLVLWWAVGIGPLPLLGFLLQAHEMSTWNISVLGQGPKKQGVLEAAWEWSGFYPLAMVAVLGGVILSLIAAYGLLILHQRPAASRTATRVRRLAVIVLPVHLCLTLWAALFRW